jgi:hypothetical protein
MRKSSRYRCLPEKRLCWPYNNPVERRIFSRTARILRNRGNSYDASFSFEIKGVRLLCFLIGGSPSMRTGHNRENRAPVGGARRARIFSGKSIWGERRMADGRYRVFQRACSRAIQAASNSASADRHDRPQDSIHRAGIRGNFVVCKPPGFEQVPGLRVENWLVP